MIGDSGRLKDARRLFTQMRTTPMKEPLQPREPWPYDYEAKVERKYIYSYVMSLQEDDGWDDGEEDDDEYKQDVDLPKKEIDKVDLAWLLSLLPEGVSPNQVKIEFGYNASSMAYEDCYVRFYYEVKIPARKQELKEAKAKYKIEKQKYDEELAAYKAWEKAEKIKQAEKELERLKHET